MPPINQPADLDRQLAALQRQLDELRHLVSLTTSRGSLILPPGTSLAVVDVDGQALVFVGASTRLRPDGQHEQGVRINRDDGTAALTVQNAYAEGTGEYQQYLGLWDRAQRVIVSDDTISGSGLARPYVPIPLTRARYTDMVAVTSQANANPDGGWVDVFDSGWFHKVNAKARVDVRCTTDVSGTTGEFRVLVDGVQVGTTQSVVFVIEVKSVGPFVVPGDAYSQHVIKVQARRTAGTGAVRVDASCWGVQS